MVIFSMLFPSSRDISSATTGNMLVIPVPLLANVTFIILPSSVERERREIEREGGREGGRGRKKEGSGVTHMIS